jgi:hypothetical protein
MLFGTTSHRGPAASSLRWGHGSGEVPRIASPMPCYPPFTRSGPVRAGLTLPQRRPGLALIHIRRENMELNRGVDHVLPQEDADVPAFCRALGVPGLADQPRRPAAARSSATRARGRAGVRRPSRPVMSSFATSALTTASSHACTTAS